MVWLLIVAVVALTVWNTTRISKLKDELSRVAYGRDYLENALKELRKELERGLAVTRTHLARVSAGERLDAGMIKEGLPWRDLIADQVQELLEREPGAYTILDVRTPGEFASGHLAGATLIPVDELERRAKELPKDRATPILVHCQSGMRSVAACEMLAEMGYGNLVHMANGIGAWRGPVER